MSTDFDQLDELLEEEFDERFDDIAEPRLPMTLPELKRQIEAEKCRRSFSYFFRQGWHVLNKKVTLVWNWHLGVVCDHVEALFRELFKARTDPEYRMIAQNLMINVPPRSAKSLIVSVFALAWAWVHDPSLKLASRSATSNVVTRDAANFRSLVMSPWYQELFQPEWRIGGKDDSGTELPDGVKKYTNTEGGFRMSATMMAKAVGTGADISIIDDPHDPEDSESELKRAGQVKKYKDSIHNRVEDGLRCVRILIMQRLHEADLTGYLMTLNNQKIQRYIRANPEAANDNDTHNKILGEQYGGWVHVVIPQLYDPKHPCKPLLTNVLGWKDPRTAKGELLFPARFTPGLIEQYREDLLEYGFAGQHQQRPSPEGGGWFKRKNWRFFQWANPDERPRAPVARPDGCLTIEKCPPVTIDSKVPFDTIHVTIDAAFKAKADGSQVGALVIGYLGSDIYYLKNRTDHMEYPETKDLITELSERYPFADVLVEDKANGSAIESELRDDVRNLIMVNPQGGKLARARAMMSSHRAARHYVEEGALESHAVIQQFAVFPVGARDDIVDSASQSAIHYIEEGSDLASARAWKNFASCAV